MMKSVFFLVALLAVSASAFAPAFLGGREANTVCFAKHVNNKAAKWAQDKRPRKSRPSDINRKPVVYELTSITKPSEYTISEAPAESVAKEE
eukprot:CAMPEP_0195273470 /NCGR_PEP_ID=MMETSP0706-20130129/16497_1 /TAXON_ID=33640 /ORGANISM="Asterionellopsis glacialis, Strain CCMP134" /LENGTH=91 /DNA_ID=CAMNT_0040330003 /DNA_START=54 /DNA_END=329 /DNA_ORIENTATION=+